MLRVKCSVCREERIVVGQKNGGSARRRARRKRGRGRRARFRLALLHNFIALSSVFAAWRGARRKKKKERKVEMQGKAQGCRDLWLTIRREELFACELREINVLRARLNSQSLTPRDRKS